MHSSRRSFLQALLALPVLAWLRPQPEPEWPLDRWIVLDEPPPDPGIVPEASVYEDDLWQGTVTFQPRQYAKSFTIERQMLEMGNRLGKTSIRQDLLLDRLRERDEEYVAALFRDGFR